MGRGFEDKGNVGKGTEEESPFPSRQEEGAEAGQSAAWYPLPVNLPSSPSQAGGAKCKEGRSGQVRSDYVQIKQLRCSLHAEGKGQGWACISAARAGLVP